jgi:2-aminoadipate transaminase
MDEQLLSNSSRVLEKSHIQKALQAPVTSDTISFALGMPATNLLPLDQYKTALDKVLSSTSLQYSPPVKALKAQIVDLMKERQVFCNQDQIFLTSGAQQAMMLITKLLVDKGDDIIIEETTYPGFIQIAESLQANLITIPSDHQNGILIEELENYLKIKNQKKTKFIYTIPEGHNPLGMSLSKEKRLKLINLAESYKIPIVEDDAYGFINYGEVVEPPLRAYSDEWIFYIGSFSKILSPSTRVGWIIVPEVLIEKLEILKEASDINTATFSQHIISSYIEMDFLSDHLSLIKKHYKEKRDIMAKTLKQYIPEMQYILPNSGFFIWGRLPKHIDTNKLFKLALETKNVSFLPGSAFGPNNKNNLTNCLRLSFAFCPLDKIEIGIKRLSLAIKLLENGIV